MENLKEFAEEYLRMRAVQNRYFKQGKKREDLIKAKQMEASLDKKASDILQSVGPAKSYEQIS